MIGVREFHNKQDFILLAGLQNTVPAVVQVHPQTALEDLVGTDKACILETCNHTQ